MSSYTLADVQNAAEAKFGNFNIEISEDETLVFLNPLRLEKAKRRRLEGLFLGDQIRARMDEDPGLDIYDLYQEAFEIAAKAPRDHERLVELIGDNPSQWTVLFNQFNGTAELGEASTSGS